MTEMILYALYICCMAWLASEIYNKGVQKGVSLTLNNFKLMHHHIDIVMVNGNGTVEYSFTKKVEANAG